MTLQIPCLNKTFWNEHWKPLHSLYTNYAIVRHEVIYLKLYKSLLQPIKLICIKTLPNPLKDSLPTFNSSLWLQSWKKWLPFTPCSGRHLQLSFSRSSFEFLKKKKTRTLNLIMLTNILSSSLCEQSNSDRLHCLGPENISQIYFF